MFRLVLSMEEKDFKYNYTEYNDELKDRARELRRKQTDEEARLWYDFLKDVKPKFYRQRPIGNYIPDFFCPKAKLIIELDGVQHYDKKQYFYDIKRTNYFKQLGIEVLRFDNTEVHYDFDDVCETIKTVLHHLHPE